MEISESELHPSPRKPKWGIIALCFTIIGNFVAYALMASSDGGPSDLAGGMIGLLIGLGNIAAIALTAFLSFILGERPIYYALTSIVVETSLILIFFEYVG